MISKKPFLTLTALTVAGIAAGLNQTTGQGANNMTRKIFVLGDSRTGTMTLHKYFLSLGINSTHYYVKEANQLSPDHENRERNLEALLHYVAHSGYTGYSDYPTRLYYRELFQTHPDAYFILTIREDVETWRKSMLGFFSKFNINLDIDNLTKYYIKLNDDIRNFFFENRGRFLELNIDLGNEANSNAIKTFLGVCSETLMGWENRTSSYDNSILSKRAQLFAPPENDFLGYINARLGDSKAMPSEHGWIYLANDTNSFLDYQFGFMSWSEEDLEIATRTLRQREGHMRDLGVLYRKYVIPEKSVVYPEFLPRCFERLIPAKNRPATLLADANLSNYTYLADYLTDAKSRGLLYFKGDTHTNWLGAYFVYYRIIESLQRDLPGSITSPIALGELNVSAAKYVGDMGAQITEELRAEVQQTWRTILPRNGEDLLRFSLPQHLDTCIDVEPPDSYVNAFSERSLFVKENRNKDLPRAVIFRDSTLDFAIDLLAQHFSRSVFIWHKGQVYEDVIAREKPDVVLHIMAERFITMYPSFPAINPGIL